MLTSSVAAGRGAAAFSYLPHSPVENPVTGGGAAAALSHQVHPSLPNEEQSSAIPRTKAIAKGCFGRNRCILFKILKEFYNPCYITSVEPSRDNIPKDEDNARTFLIPLYRKIMSLLEDRASWEKVSKVDCLSGSLSLDSRENLDEYDENNETPKLSTHVNFHVDLRVRVFNGVVNLHFKPRNSKLLGEGAYKTVHKTQDLFISLTTATNGKMLFGKTTPSPSVRKVIKNLTHPAMDRRRAEKEKKENFQMLLRGRKLHQEYYHLLLASQKKDQRLTEVRLANPEVDIGNNETSQLHYLSNLHAARKTMSMHEALSCVKSVALTLQWLNNQGVIHRDAAPRNINIQRNTEGKLEAFLADFDFAKKDYGYDSLLFPNLDYYIWDPCAAYDNLATPYLDLHSAALLLCCILMPHLSVQNPKNVSTNPNDSNTKMAAMCDCIFFRLKAMSQVDNKFQFNPTFFLNCYKERHPNQPLNENQKKALLAFFRISYESAMLRKQCNNLVSKQKNFNYPKDVGHTEILNAIESLKKTELFPQSGHPTYTFQNLIDLITEIQQNPS